MITIGTARDPARKREESVDESDTVAPEADRNERVDETKASPRDYLESMVVRVHSDIIVTGDDGTFDVEKALAPEETRDTHTGLNKAPLAGTSGERDTEQDIESGILQPSRVNSQAPE